MGSLQISSVVSHQLLLRCPGPASADEAHLVHDDVDVFTLLVEELSVEQRRVPWGRFEGPAQYPLEFLLMVVTSLRRLVLCGRAVVLAIVTSDLS